MPSVTQSALLGVGLEDGLYIGRGELATSNAKQVAKVVRRLTEFGRGSESTALAAHKDHKSNLL